MGWSNKEIETAISPASAVEARAVGDVRRW